MALKDLEARYATKRDKDYKLTDGEGLCLLLRTNGSKLWRFNTALPAGLSLYGPAGGATGIRPSI